MTLFPIYSAPINCSTGISYNLIKQVYIVAVGKGVGREVRNRHDTIAGGGVRDPEQKEKNVVLALLNGGTDCYTIHSPAPPPPVPCSESRGNPEQTYSCPPTTPKDLYVCRDTKPS